MPATVMRGLVPRIHVSLCRRLEKTWMAGTSPAMTLGTPGKLVGWAKRSVPTIFAASGGSVGTARCAFAHPTILRSNIRGEIDQFVEQNTGLRQQPFDLVGGLDDRPSGRVDHEFRVGRRLVIIADSRKAFQRARAGLGVVALGVAAFADFGWGCDIDL